MAFFLWKRRSPETRDAVPVSPVYSFIHDAHAQLVLERYDEARPFLLRALESRNEITDATTIDYLLASLGATWLLTEKYEEGIVSFSKHIDRHPKDWTAHRERGSLLWYSGQLDEAIRDYSAALALRPNDILSLSGRGQVLAEIGNAQEAMEDLNLALAELTFLLPELDPALRRWYQDIEAFIHNGRAVALATLGQSASATNEFELSISMCPDNAWVYFNRGRVFDNAHDPAKAISDFGIALGKKSPPLNPRQKAHAEKRIRELQSRMGF